MMKSNEFLQVKIYVNGIECARLFEDESKKLDKVLEFLDIQSTDRLFIAFGDQRDTEGMLYANNLVGVVMGEHLKDRCYSKYHVSGTDMIKILNGDMKLRRFVEQYFDEEDKVDSFDNMDLLVMKFGKLVPKQVVDF